MNINDPNLPVNQLINVEGRGEALEAVSQLLNSGEPYIFISLPRSGDDSRVVVACQPASVLQAVRIMRDLAERVAIEVLLEQFRPRDESD
jgi:hypothetical protein